MKPCPYIASLFIVIGAGILHPGLAFLAIGVGLWIGWADKAPTPIESCDQPSGIEAQVCEDIARRQQMGLQKYGTTVSDNPLPLKAWLQHAYEESLDHAIYLKRAMAEL